MGVGRRMKKQGPPPPLDESLVTKKRKDAPIEPANDRGKKRRTEAGKTRKAVKLIEMKKSKKSALTNVHGTAKLEKTKANNGRKMPKKTVAPPVEDEDDPLDDEDLVSDDADGIDDPDVMEDKLDGVNVGGLDALGSASDSDGLEDDEFVESDSDVVDSDTEVRKGMWSEDEDDEDVEEKLTAANIEGLSRRLDMQKAIEDAEAQAELEEACTSDEHRWR
jgi:ribosomal RNA methyltransferase Nop2